MELFQFVFVCVGDRQVHIIVRASFVCVHVRAGDYSITTAPILLFLLAISDISVYTPLYIRLGGVCVFLCVHVCIWVEGCELGWATERIRDTN